MRAHDRFSMLMGITADTITQDMLSLKYFKWLQRYNDRILQQPNGLNFKYILRRLIASVSKSCHTVCTECQLSVLNAQLQQKFDDTSQNAVTSHRLPPSHR